MNANLEKTFGKLPLEELLEAQTKLKELIESQKMGKKQDLVDQFKQMASSAGLTIEQVVWAGEGKASGKKRGRKAGAKSRPPKFRHPTDSKITWPGVGKRPLWYKAWIEEGKNPDDLLINRA